MICRFHYSLNFKYYSVQYRKVTGDQYCKKVRFDNYTFKLQLKLSSITVYYRKYKLNKGPKKVRKWNKNVISRIEIFFMRFLFRQIVTAVGLNYRI